jgi:ATP-binding cassette subfamily F protein 3
MDRARAAAKAPAARSSAPPEPVRPPSLPAGPLKRRLEAAETTLARETTALAALDAELSDPALYAKPASEQARLTARHAQLADRLAKAEAAWLAAAEAYETSAGD